MNEQMVALLEGLGTKLGVATEVLWTALLKQAAIYSTIYFLSFIATFTVLYFLYRFICNIKDKDSEVFLVSIILSGISGVVIFICFIATLSTAIAGFFNPEYWALSRILGIM